jgi:transposase
MNTLYFEASEEDDYRIPGFNKDGKHQQPQIMIGLLVSGHSYPIGYQIFEGNTSETKTLIPILEAFQNKFDIDKPIVVADAALLSKKNIDIDYEKYHADKIWDGLKSYVTNTQLSREKVVENYSQLWDIEKAFRISKTDLRIRPIYLRLRNRVEAHICICCAAYSVYKELEIILNLNKINLSREKAISEIK